MGCSPEAGCEGGRAASFCQRRNRGKRRRRPQGDQMHRRRRGLGTGPIVLLRHHSFNLQCLNPIWKRSWQHFGALTQFRCNCPGENWVGCSPEWGRGVKGGDAALRTGNRRGFGRSTVQIYDAGSGSASTRVYESLRESTRVYESLREFTRVYESLREFLRESTRVCESLREFARVYESLREFARVCESLREFARVYESLREFARIYESLREFARVCESLREFT